MTLVNLTVLQVGAMNIKVNKYFLGLIFSICAGTSVSAAELVQFPEQVDSFKLMETHEYDDPGLGYTVRFYDGERRNKVDVYIYPVQSELYQYSHSDLVAIYMQSARQDIHAAKDQGMYINVDDLDLLQYEADGNIILKSTHKILSGNNEELYSVVYLTEYLHNIVKVRVSVPADITNYMTEQFQETVFKLILLSLDGLERQEQQAN